MAKKEREAMKPSKVAPAPEVQKRVYSRVGKSLVLESRGQAKFVSPKPEDEVSEEMVSPAIIINRLDHNMTLSYNGAAMIIPPRGKRLIANSQMLGSLPKGMQLVPVAK